MDCGGVEEWNGPLTTADWGIHCRLCHSYLTALQGSVSGITVTSVWHAKYMMSATALESCPLSEDGYVCVCVHSLYVSMYFFHKFTKFESLCEAIQTWWLCNVNLYYTVTYVPSCYDGVSYWRRKLSVVYLTSSTTSVGKLRLLITLK